MARETRPGAPAVCVPQSETRADKSDHAKVCQGCPNRLTPVRRAGLHFAGRINSVGRDSARKPMLLLHVCNPACLGREAVVGAKPIIDFRVCRQRMLLSYFASASLSSRRIASGFDGFGSGCSAIQASSVASRSGWTRTPIIRPIPVRGRPIFFFSRSAIATVQTFCYQNIEPGQGGDLAPGSDHETPCDGGE